MKWFKRLIQTGDSQWLVMLHWGAGEFVVTERRRTKTGIHRWQKRTPCKKTALAQFHAKADEIWLWHNGTKAPR